MGVRGIAFAVISDRDPTNSVIQNRRLMQQRINRILNAAEFVIDRRESVSGGIDSGDRTAGIVVDCGECAAFRINRRDLPTGEVIDQRRDISGGVGQLCLSSRIVIFEGR